MMDNLCKVINNCETPVKDQCIRSIINETHKQEGAKAFWDCIPRLPLQESGIACWKFCHLLHKVLQEGHSNAIIDSQPFSLTLLDYGRFWDRSNECYGSLAKSYCNLLSHKLNFHMRNDKIAALKINHLDLLNCVTGGDRALVKVCLEMFDYIDALLELWREICKQMEDGRINSMTDAGQCMLKPLLICIEEVLLLYDHTTKIMYRLHEKEKIPEDQLRRHRLRSDAAYWDLKKFSEKTMSFQYCRNVIEIQQFSKKSPNFFWLTDILENFEAPKIIFHSLEQDIHSDAFTLLTNPTLPQAQRSTLREKRKKELETDIERLNAELNRLNMESEITNGSQSNEVIPTQNSHTNSNVHQLPNFGWTVPKDSLKQEKDSCSDDTNRESTNHDHSLGSNSTTKDSTPKENKGINLIEEMEKYQSKKQMQTTIQEVSEVDYGSAQTSQSQLKESPTKEPKTPLTGTTNTNNVSPPAPPPPPGPPMMPPKTPMTSLTDSRSDLLNQIRNFNSNSLKTKTENKVEKPEVKSMGQSQRESLISSLQDRMKEMRPHIANSDDEDEFSDEF